MKALHPAASLHVLPPIVFLSLAGVFSGLAAATVRDSPVLVPILTISLLTLVPFVLAFLAARGYAEQGARFYLLLGCGMVSTGFSSFVSGLGMATYGTNFAVTIHNLGSLMAGTCHLSAVALMLKGRPSQGRPSKSGAAKALAASFLAPVFLITLLSLCVAAGVVPGFFVNTRGPTVLRQAVLTLASTTYVVSAILLVGLHARTGMRFFALYADALFLMAIGLGAVMLTRDFGNALGWIGRASQYAGSLYLVIALVVGRKETGSKGSSLPKYMTELFRSGFEGEVRARTSVLLELNRRLEVEVAERRLAEERLRLAAEATGFGVYAFDFESLRGYYSPEFLSLFGLPPGAALPVDSDLLPTALDPDDREEFLSRVTGANDPRGAGIFEMEYRICRADGETRWLRVRGRTTFRVLGGKSVPSIANGIIQDVTERKQVEEQIREREEMYRSVIDNSLQGIAIVQDGRIVLCNDALCRMNGYSKEEAYALTPEQVFETIHPDDRQAVFEATRELLGSGKAPAAGVIRLIDKSGHVRWVEALGARSSLRGRPAVQISYLDVTEKRRAEEAYRSLVDHALEGFAIVKNGRFVFANPALEALSGFTAAELIGMSREEIAEFIHADDRARLFRNMALRLAGEEAPAIQTYRIMRRDGTTCLVETQSVVVDYEGIPAIQVTYKDVTAVRAAAQEVTAAQTKMRNLAGHLLYAREEERRKVAQEVHDELGQTLAALKMDMHWLDKHLRNIPAEAAEKIRGMIDLGEQTIDTVRRISSELRPRMLDDLGLSPALEWLASDFTRRTGIECAVTTDFSPFLIGGNAATTFYRVVQEALSNVMRHSHAHHAGVGLCIQNREVVLTVRDDGVGITPRQAAAPESYGLIGMHERIEGLGGRLRVAAGEAPGTFLEARIPLPDEGGIA